jgi:hypothetical protein
MTKGLGLRLGIGVLMTMMGIGCGGGSGSGGVCSGLDPCGGDIEGTWAIDSMCIAGDIVAAMSGDLGLPSACSGALTSFAFENPSGTITYAGGYETANLTITMSMAMTYNSACASAAAGTTVTVDATLCSLLQQDLLASSDYSSVACSFGGGACHCAVKGEQTSSGVTGYTVSGNTIEYTDGSDPMDYCVSGAQLTESQIAPDYANLKMIANFHRQ